MTEASNSWFQKKVIDFEIAFMICSMRPVKIIPLHPSVIPNKPPMYPISVCSSTLISVVKLSDLNYPIVVNSKTHYFVKRIQNPLHKQPKKKPDTLELATLR